MTTNDPLLRPEEVAELFGVDTRTVARWSNDGTLRSVRTVGGHRRYRKSDVDALYQQLHNN